MKWIGESADDGLNKIYFMIRQQDEKDTTILADYAIIELNERLGAAYELHDNVEEPGYAVAKPGRSSKNSSWLDEYGSLRTCCSFKKRWFSPFCNSSIAL